MTSTSIPRQCNEQPNNIATYYPRATANYHITMCPISQVLSAIITSHRRHFPDDVVNDPITLLPITQLLPPINPSYCILFPRCCRQLLHHIDIISQMMQVIIRSHRHILPMCCRQLPDDINIIYPCDTANNHTTSHRHHFPDDVINSPITSPPITHVLPPIIISHCVLFPSCCHQLLHHIDIISYMMQSMTPAHCHLLPMCCRQLPHTTFRLISQVLPPITTSHRHHFLHDVVNNPITSPPITQVLSQITR